MHEGAPEAAWFSAAGIEVLVLDVAPYGTDLFFDGGGIGGGDGDSGAKKGAGMVWFKEVEFGAGNGPFLLWVVFDQEFVEYCLAPVFAPVGEGGGGWLQPGECFLGIA